MSKGTMKKLAVGRLLPLLALGLLGPAALAAPVQASEGIKQFESTISTHEAGGHPDIETSFTLENPGAPEAARNVIFNTPEGVFGNPEAVPQCTSLDFAQQQCPSSSQVGLITIHANYEGNPNFSLGTAPIFDLEVPDDQTATFAFIVPTLDIPINIPVTVRSSTDYGLRFTVSNMTELAPLASAKLIFWGFPAASEHDAQRFPKGSPGKPAGCPGIDTTECLSEKIESPNAVHPLTDNPTVCSGQKLVSQLEVQTYQDLANLTEATDEYPLIEGCLNEVFKPVLSARPTTSAADSASGLDLELSNQQFLGVAVSPSELRSVCGYPRRRADRQPGRRRWPERLHRRAGQLRLQRARRNARTTPRSGRSASTRWLCHSRWKAQFTSANRSRGTSTGSSSPRTDSASTRRSSAR